MTKAKIEGADSQFFILRRSEAICSHIYVSYNSYYTTLNLFVAVVLCLDVDV